MRSAAVTLALLATSTPVLGAQSAAATLTLVGENGIKKVLTTAELEALPQEEVTVLEADSSRVVFRGPTVRSLMTLVGAPTGHALRGPAMLLAVLAKASDGYQAASPLDSAGHPAIPGASWRLTLLLDFPSCASLPCHA